MYRWIRKRKEEENIYPRAHWQKGYGHKIPDLEVFRKFIEENPKRTLVEMAEAWGGVKRMTIYRALKKLCFKHKKISYGYKERREPERQAYLEHVATLRLSIYENLTTFSSDVESQIITQQVFSN